MSYENFLTWIREIPDHLKLQEMCNEAFDIEPFSLAFIPDHFKTQEICERVVEEGSYMQMFVPDHFKTKMCEKAVKAYPWLLWYVLIDLWYYKKCGVKTLMLLIILLGGEMHIKNERLKKPQ